MGDVTTSIGLLLDGRKVLLRDLHARAVFEFDDIQHSSNSDPSSHRLGFRRYLANSANPSPLSRSAIDGNVRKRPYGRTEVELVRAH